MELITKPYQENYKKMLLGEADLSNLVLSTEKAVLELGSMMIEDLLD